MQTSRSDYDGNNINRIIDLTDNRRNTVIPITDLMGSIEEQKKLYPLNLEGICRNCIAHFHFKAVKDKSFSVWNHSWSNYF